MAEESVQEALDKADTCRCAFCLSGDTPEERMNESLKAIKRLREGLKGYDFKPMFKRMYGLKGVK